MYSREKMSFPRQILLKVHLFHSCRTWGKSLIAWSIVGWEGQYSFTMFSHPASVSHIASNRKGWLRGGAISFWSVRIRWWSECVLGRLMIIQFENISFHLMLTSALSSLSHICALPPLPLHQVYLGPWKPRSNTPQWSILSWKSRHLEKEGGRPSLFSLAY